MRHGEVVGPVGVDGDVAGDGDAGLVDGSLQVEVLHERGNVDADLKDVETRERYFLFVLTMS